MVQIVHRDTMNTIQTAWCISYIKMYNHVSDFNKQEHMFKKMEISV